MTSQSLIHVFDQGNYSNHRLVAIPQPAPRPLGPSSLRLKTRILGQSTNNLTYANFGFALGWWAIYPIPDSAPEPFNDRSKYATIAGWGYADVVDSTVPAIPTGASVYGYLHIGTATWDVAVEQAECEGQFVVTNPQRQNLWKLYNRLAVWAPLGDVEKEQGSDGLGWDALMQPLFGTGYNLSTYGFAWEDGLRIHPSGEGAWSAADADVDDALVVVLNAGGKTGMGFAYSLRQCRPEGRRPKTVVGVGSQTSKGLISGCGFYDEVLLYSETEKVKELVAASSFRRILLLDFGSRPGVMVAYTEALSSLSVPLARFFIGGDNRPKKAEDIMKSQVTRGEGVQVNANVLREKGVQVDGEKYFSDFNKAWGEFKKQGAIPGTKLVWGEGLEGWEKGWEAFCKDEVRGDEGRVYRL